MKTKPLILIAFFFVTLCGMSGTVALSPIGEPSPVGAEVPGSVPVGMLNSVKGFVYIDPVAQTTTNGFSSVGLDSINSWHIYDSHCYLPSTDGHMNFRQIANFSSGTGGLECYFINSFVDARRIVGLNCDSGLLLTKSATAVDWAHEIGHACGLKDIYHEQDNGLIPESRKFVCSDAPGDWNDGSAPGHASARYYAADTKLVDIIERLLMYGYGGSTADWRHVDISTGPVRGLNILGQMDSVATGIFGVPFSSAARSPTHK